MLFLLSFKYSHKLVKRELNVDLPIACRTLFSHIQFTEIRNKVKLLDAIFDQITSL